MDINTFLKKHIRPSLIPIFRFFIRYLPVQSIRSLTWRSLSPFLQFADYPFNAKTIFDMYISGNTIDEIQRRIYYFGQWEPNLTSFLKSRLSPGDIFIDVGANIGYFSLLAAKLVGPSGKVYSIEASPLTFRKLSDNIRQNKLDNVISVNLAASDHHGVVNLYAGPPINIGMTTTIETNEFTLEGEITCMPLDAILPSKDLKRVKAVKIDVEGAEWAVIKGMTELLYSGHEDLEVAIEINTKRLAHIQKDPLDIFRVFESAGFKPYEVVNHYSDSEYLFPAYRKRPLRFTRPIEGIETIDIVFSRKDTAIL